MAELVFVEESPVAGRIIEPRGDYRIGRDECDIALTDPEVSRWHAVLRLTSSGLAIEDLGSTNGTWVNGERIDAVTPLAEGDRVRVGNTQWLLTTPHAPTRVAQPRPFP